MAICVGITNTIAKGLATILIGKMPAARMLDTCSHGGMIAGGCTPVLIGD